MNTPNLLLIVFGHLYLGDVWIDVDLRMDTTKRVFTIVRSGAQNLLAILDSLELFVG